MTSTGTAAAIRRRHVEIAGRRVHYRELGDGAPLVLLHGSPASSELLEPEMRAFAASHRCLALDTPGFGDSDPLDAPVDIPKLADALAATLQALELPACVVFGSHTGAAIAVELGVRHPDRVKGLLLDGLPMFDADEQARLFAGYFAPLAIDALGGHFAHVWTRFRDLFQWFPWNQPHPANLNDAALPTPERLQRWVTMFYRAAPHYAEPYRAAIAWGSVARTMVERLPCPTVFGAMDADMLQPHLARLPGLRPGQSVLRFAATDRDTAWSRAAAGLEQATTVAAPAAIAGRVARSLPAVTAQRDTVPGSTASSRLRHRFVDLAHGQVLLRHSRDPESKPAVLWLHDVPGSARQLEPRLATMSRRFHVLAPDLPGSGESTPLATEPAPIAAYVGALQSLLDAVIDGDPVVVVAEGYSTCLGAALARGLPGSVRGLVLIGPCAPDDRLRERLLLNHSSPITLEPDGAHWYRTWLMLRDSRIRFPWFDGRVEALRRRDLPLDAQSLHDLTLEVLKQPTGWHHLIRAALGASLDTDVEALGGLPVAVMADPSQPFDVLRTAFLARHPALADASARVTSDFEGWLEEIIGSS